MQFQNPRAHFVIDLGNDRFDVITGYKLNEAPLDLAAANRIAYRSTASVTSVAGIAGSDDHDRRRRREMM
jgi:hypothetical protein